MYIGQVTFDLCAMVCLASTRKIYFFSNVTVSVSATSKLGSQWESCFSIFFNRYITYYCFLENIIILHF